MSEKVRDVSKEYRAAEKRAREVFQPGHPIDLPAMLNAAFVQGYAQCLIDKRWPEGGSGDV